MRIANEILMFFRSKKNQINDVSLNDTIDVDRDGNPLTYMDIISVEDAGLYDIELRGYFKKLLSLVDSVLSPREKEIIVLRYGLKGYKPLTQREVALHLGISRSYVSRIEKKALGLLKNAFGKDIPDFDS